MELADTGDGRVVEIGQPERCSNGHPLGPRLVIVGWLPCICAGIKPGSGHRTFTCRECDDVTYIPGHDRNELPPPR